MITRKQAVERRAGLLRCSVVQLLQNLLMMLITVVMMRSWKVTGEIRRPPALTRLRGVSVHDLTKCLTYRVTPSPSDPTQT